MSKGMCDVGSQGFSMKLATDSTFLMAAVSLAREETRGRSWPELVNLIRSISTAYSRVRATAASPAPLAAAAATLDDTAACMATRAVWGGERGVCCKGEK
jgi:hypothetical protein